MKTKHHQGYLVEVIGYELEGVLYDSVAKANATREKELGSFKGKGPTESVRFIRKLRKDEILKPVNQNYEEIKAIL